MPGDLQPDSKDRALRGIYGDPEYFGAQFTMEVDFDPNHPEVPNLEYQQWVLGSFGRQKRGQSGVRIVPHEMPDGSYLSPSSIGRDGKWGYYGDRTRSYVGFLADHYYDVSGRTEDRKNGPKYRGWDAPGIAFDPAVDERVEVDLTFLGVVVHTPSKRIVRSKRWKVKGELDV